MIYFSITMLSFLDSACRRLYRVWAVVGRGGLDFDNARDVESQEDATKASSGDTLSPPNPPEGT